MTADAKDADFAQQMRMFRDRLAQAGLTPEIDPHLSPAEQFARLQDAVLGEIARCRELVDTTSNVEDELRESEARLRTVLETLPIGVLIVDQHNRIIETNGNAERIYGGAVPLPQPMQEYRHGKAWWVATGKPLADDDWPSMQALEQGTPVPGREISILRADGARGIIFDAAAPLRNAAGEITGAVVVIIDITERKQAEAARESALQQAEVQRGLLETVVMNIPAGVILVHGDDLIIEVVNPAYQAIAPGKAMQGRLFREVWPEVYPVVGELFLRVLHTGDPYHAVDEQFLIKRTPEGPLEPAYFTWTLMRVRLPGEEEWGVLNTAVETTERMHAQEERERLLREVQQRSEELQQLNLSLEQRVRERTAALEVTNKELEAFSYSVSHDLRAPLRSIDGFSRVLMEDYPDRLDERGRDYLTRVQNAAQRMNRLIEDMLKLSRTGRAEMHRETVNLSDLATAIIDELRQREPERHVKVTIMPDLRVSGDAGLLRIVLDNLLGNAWKFTGKREDAYIEFGMITQDETPVYFVRDNGAGFDMAYADKLFTPFQRLHTEAEFPGTGIGLAIVQRIIARHGGRVWVEATERQGATIYFTLAAGEAH